MHYIIIVYDSADLVGLRPLRRTPGRRVLPREHRLYRRFGLCPRATARRPVSTQRSRIRSALTRRGIDSVHT